MTAILLWAGVWASFALVGFSSRALLRRCYRPQPNLICGRVFPAPGDERWHRLVKRKAPKPVRSLQSDDKNMILFLADKHQLQAPPVSIYIPLSAPAAEVYALEQIRVFRVMGYRPRRSRKSRMRANYGVIVNRVLVLEDGNQARRYFEEIDREVRERTAQRALDAAQKRGSIT